MNDDALTFSPVSVLSVSLCLSGSDTNSKMKAPFCAVYKRPKLGDCREKEELRGQEKRPTGTVSTLRGGHCVMKSLRTYVRNSGE